MLSLRIFAAWVGFGAVLGLSAPAMAHPHIFIDGKVAVVFDESGALTTLRHEWRFDEAFSSWIIQGLDTNKDGVTSSEEMQELADDNVAGLSQFGFYTAAGEDDNLMSFHAAGDQRMAYEDGRVVLNFSAEADVPRPMAGRFELGISDPEYYVAITFAGPEDVVLENAPAGCGVILEPPREIDPDVANRLYALGPEVLELPPDLAAAMRDTQGLIVIDCPGGAPPATALDAISSATATRTLPFGGPPPEPGLNLPRTGFFGWVQEQQRLFYGAMTNALGALRQDWTAFWILGGLSFLYGVFHAAGPGHGKVVISSYMLANETQLRRGIGLSLVSSLLQSMVAIVFVLLAAGLLGMTSMAMGAAANWIGIASYALIVLLGLWLILRKVLGLGHRHHHHDMAGKARAHLHDHEHHHDHDHHDHHHVVTPETTGRDWREQLGVVLSVGLRPCSGALVVMVFALSQGLVIAGMAAVLLMGLGTAITVAALAVAAVTAKGLARRIGGIDNPVTGALVWWLELLGAVLVLAFGVILLLASI